MKTSFRSQFLIANPDPQILDLSQKSPFEDCAKTHTFSDWLLAFSFNCGYDPDSSYSLGALPDLKKDINYFQKKDLLPLGQLFEEKLSGKYFIDLGSGDPTISLAPQIIAEFFKAKSYIGVDLNHIREDFEGFKKSVAQSFFKMDLLEFVSRLELPVPKTFFLGGIDPQADLAEAERLTKYLIQLREQLSRVCIPGDLVILGAGSTGLELEQAPRKFECIYRDFFHEISECVN
ncbi:MAG: hypothetical protein J0L93_08105 [Deltaproteobacteria bacterium]|nr:hypothetical protein [Deltaproteobacteria bacterium]